MRILIVKAVLAAAIVNGISADAYSAASRMSYSINERSPAVQSELYRAYGFLKSFLDYLLASEVEQWRPQRDVCNPKRIVNKELAIKCGFVKE